MTRTLQLQAYTLDVKDNCYRPRSVTPCSWSGAARGAGHFSRARGSFSTASSRLSPVLLVRLGCCTTNAYTRTVRRCQRLEFEIREFYLNATDSDFTPDYQIPAEPNPH